MSITVLCMFQINVSSDIKTIEVFLTVDTKRIFLQWLWFELPQTPYTYAAFDRPFDPQTPTTIYNLSVIDHPTSCKVKGEGLRKKGIRLQWLINKFACRSANGENRFKKSGKTIEITFWIKSL